MLFVDQFINQFAQKYFVLITLEHNLLHVIMKEKDKQRKYYVNYCMCMTYHIRP